MRDISSVVLKNRSPLEYPIYRVFLKTSGIIVLEVDLPTNQRELSKQS